MADFVFTFLIYYLKGSSKIIVMVVGSLRFAEGDVLDSGVS